MPIIVPYSGIVHPGSGGGGGGGGGGELVTPTLASWPITTSAALARAPSKITTLNGTDNNGHTHNPGSDSETLDARGFTGIGWNDYDSGRYPNGPHGSSRDLCVSQCGTALGTNNKPLKANTGNPFGPNCPDKYVIVGGKIQFDQDPNLPWEIMKHGRYFQNELDANRDPYDEPGQPTNSWDGGGLVVKVSGKPGGWALIDGIRMYNTMDGITIWGNDGTAGENTADNDLYIRNWYAERCHDTTVASEDGVRFHMFDVCLINSYGLVDWQNGPAMGNQIGMTVEGSIISLEPLPGGFKEKSSASTHDDLWKADNDSPRLSMRRCIVKVGPNLRTADAGDLPGDGVYEDVLLLWDSDAPFNRSVPDGVTVVNPTGTQRATVQSMYATAVARWKTRHGFTSFNVVDMAKMISPDPLLWPLDY